MKELKCPHCGNMFAVDESDYVALLGQVRNAEFERELNKRMQDMEQTQKMREQADEARRKAEEQAAQAQMQIQLQALQAQVQQAEQAKQLAVAQVRQQATEAYMRKEQELAQARSQTSEVRSQLEAQLKAAQAQVDYYKDLKIKLSTKMVGETLEQHCYNEFTRISPLFPNAEFHKDNDVVEGTKGDFVFRDKSDDGVEYVSIMFEMKNENDETATKHKNQDFFRKLDEDRKKKNCEYAVLVSLLEPENELYNNGIVSVLQNDKGEKFEKMYVIRPQFFVPLITLLCQTSKKSLDAKRELALVRSQQIDVTHFEEKLNAFKDGFARNVRLANERFADAIDEIDKTIAHLTKVRENLVKSGDNLNQADKKLEDVTVKRLTYGNPTMKAKFDEARETTAPDEF